MKKSVAWLVVLAVTCLLTACGKQEATDYMSWLPDSYVPETEQTVQGNDYLLRQEAITSADNASATSYEAEELVDLLLKNDSEQLADKLWETQIANGAYTVTKEELNKNMLTFYVSSSEGDDNNLGLSPEEPKKTLGQFSGRANITVLLKCGDVFELDDTFYAGNGCIYATYGQGRRPVVSFYKKLEVSFEQMPDYKNVWVADLLNVEGVYNGLENKDNCNIGQLIIDGVTNWKRVVCSTTEYETFDFPADIAARADGSWSVDWLQSKMYLFSKEDPNTKEIWLAPDVHGFVCQGREDVVLKGWTITGAGAHGCNITNAKNVAVTNCFFYEIGGSVHRSAGIRYGNAVQIWDSGTDITIAYNYADWVFDTCYTNQGSAETSYCENVVFEKNIGAHSFTGIETWADSYSENPFVNLAYRNNIIYSMCDITDPDQELFSDKKGFLLLSEEEAKEYVSYRGGYTYNQMACMNVTGSQKPGGLSLEGNVLWNPKRLLVLCGSNIFPYMANNVLYAEVPSSSAYMYRYTDLLGERVYLWRMEKEDNLEYIQVGHNATVAKEAKNHLIGKMNEIVH